jgi:putative redox protein
MAIVTATIGDEKYSTKLTTPTHEIIADEPVDLGGTDLGFAPSDLLSASLASCTAITLRMYADRSNWDVKEIIVIVDLERESGTKVTSLSREITLKGNLDEKQRNRLLAVANACPMHKVLSGNIQIDTRLED